MCQSLALSGIDEEKRVFLAKFYDAMMSKYTIMESKKRKYHPAGTLFKTEVMLILFHGSSYRCLKHFYLEAVCKHMRYLFPRVVSYNRFVELGRDVAIPLALFIKKVLLGKCTGISSVDSHHSMCARTREYTYTRRLRELPKGASVPWAGSSVSGCI